MCVSSGLLELPLACKDFGPAIIEDSQEGEAKLLVLVVFRVFSLLPRKDEGLGFSKALFCNWAWGLARFLNHGLSAFTRLCTGAFT